MVANEETFVGKGPGDRVLLNCTVLNVLVDMLKLSEVVDVPLKVLLTKIEVGTGNWLVMVNAGTVPLALTKMMQASTGGVDVAVALMLKVVEVKLSPMVLLLVVLLLVTTGAKVDEALEIVTYDENISKRLVSRR